MLFISPQTIENKIFWFVHNKNDIYITESASELKNYVGDEKTCLTLPIINSVYGHKNISIKNKKKQNELFSQYFKNHPSNEDGENYSLTTGPYIKNNLWCCAVSEEKQASWVNQLKNEKINISNIIPEFAPYQQEDGWYVYHHRLLDEIHIVKISKNDDVGFFRFSMNHHGALLVEGLEGLANIFNDDSKKYIDINAVDIFDKLKIEKRLPENWCEWTTTTESFKYETLSNSLWLTSEFKIPDFEKVLKPLSLILFAMLLTNFIGLQWYSWQAKKAISSQRLQIVKTVQQLFPKLDVVLEPVKQMKMEIDNIPQKASYRNDFSYILQWLTTNGISIGSINWENNILNIESTGNVDINKLNKANMHKWKITVDNKKITIDVRAL